MVHYNSPGILVIILTPATLLLMYFLYRYIKRKNLQKQKAVKKDETVLAIE